MRSHTPFRDKERGTGVRGGSARARAKQTKRETEIVSERVRERERAGGGGGGGGGEAGCPVHFTHIILLSFPKSLLVLIMY